MWDTLEMIYGFFDSIEQEQINTQGEEDENTSFKCFSKVRNIKNYIRTLVTKQCLWIKNWKFKLILKLNNGSLHEFQEKSRKKKVIEKLSKLVQLLKYEGASSKTEESPTSSNSYQTTPIVSFERTYSIVEKFLEDLT